MGKCTYLLKPMTNKTTEPYIFLLISYYFQSVIPKTGAEPLALFNCSSSEIIDPFRKASLCRVFNLVDRALDVLTCRSQ